MFGEFLQTFSTKCFTDKNLWEKFSNNSYGWKNNFSLKKEEHNKLNRKLWVCKWFVTFNNVIFHSVCKNCYFQYQKVMKRLWNHKFWFYFRSEKSIIEGFSLYLGVPPSVFPALAALPSHWSDAHSYPVFFLVLSADYTNTNFSTQHEMKKTNYNYSSTFFHFFLPKT